MSRFPPGPTTHPIVQLGQWMFTPTWLLDRCHKRYGEAFTLRLPAEPTRGVVFTEPEVVRDIFTAPDDVMSASRANEILRVFVGSSSIFLMDGERHVRERRLLMPPFHGERMRAYTDTMREVTRQEIARWPRGAPFALHPAMQAITLEVIIRAVFGVTGGPVYRQLHSVISRSLTVGTKPWLLLPQLQVDLGRFNAWGRFVALRRQGDAILRREIERRRCDGDTDRDDVLSMLLQARDEDGAPMTADELIDELRSLLVAGHETTATSLAWFFDLAFHHPKAWRTIVEQVRDVVGDEPVCTEHLARLTWLDGAITETLRLRPVTPLAARILMVDSEVGGYSLPAGTLVSPATFLTHRRPDIYPDPYAFRPERWLDDKPPSYAFFPFGGGRRRCVGLAFARHEMKVVLAEILARLDLRAASRGMSRIARRGITIAPARGVRAIAA